MPESTSSLQLPDYHTFLESIAILALPISASELHGVMCGYLAADANQAGESYLRALMQQKNDTTFRAAALALFNIYTVSQQQITNFGFEFQLLLPDENQSLATRAQAFSEWCEGFSQGVTMAGLDSHQLHDEESQEAIAHITEFGQLDYQSLHVDEEDEQALMEVTEYTRMAVLLIYSSTQAKHSQNKRPGKTH